jgi:hypothetical protein
MFFIHRQLFSDIYLPDHMRSFLDAYTAFFGQYKGTTDKVFDKMSECELVKDLPKLSQSSASMEGLSLSSDGLTLEKVGEPKIVRSIYCTHSINDGCFGNYSSCLFVCLFTYL